MHPPEHRKPRKKSHCRGFAGCAGAPSSGVLVLYALPSCDLATDQTKQTPPRGASGTARTHPPAHPMAHPRRQARAERARSEVDRRRARAAPRRGRRRWPSRDSCGSSLCAIVMWARGQIDARGCGGASFSGCSPLLASTHARTPRPAAARIIRDDDDGAPTRAPRRGEAERGDRPRAVLVTPRARPPPPASVAAPPPAAAASAAAAAAGA